ncbi:MAG: hypothetical protein AB7O97_06080 [Planctomycetota bacterium]
MPNALPSAFVVLSLLAPAAAQLPDFAHDLGHPVADVREVGAPDAADVTAIAAVTGLSTEQLAAVRLHRGTVVRGEDRHETVMLQIGLPDPAAGCRLAVAVTEDGRIAGIGVWGAPDFDDDPTRRWSVFLSGLARNREFHRPDGRLTRTALKESLEQRPEDQQRLIPRLLAQRQIMQATAAALQQYKLLGKEDKVLPFADLAWLARAAKGLAAGAGAFEDQLGEGGVATYREHATELAAMLDALAAIDPAAEIAGVRPQVQAWLDKDTCTKCHDAAVGGGELEQVLSRARRALDLPTGLMQVGYDLPPALGDRDGRSQAVVTGLRAALLLAQKAW